MFSAIWEWMKGLFVGKGTSQFGSRNQSVSNVTVGDGASGGVMVANQMHVHQSPPPLPPMNQVELVPTPAEIQILVGLANSQAGYLHRVKAEGNCVVVIDGEALNSPYDASSSVKMHEAVNRLLKYGLLVDVSQNDEMLHLSTKGKDAAEQIRKQIEVGDCPDYAEIERLMPELLAEMKANYANQPLIREIVILDTEGNRYNGDGVFIYHRSKHENLDSKLQILGNHGLLTNITNITYNNAERYRVSEKFARYLMKK